MPGGFPWRQVAVFNPAVIRHDGAFYMFERACSSLDPLKCQVGLLRSEDGVTFTHVQDYPVLAPEQFGAPGGTVEDPRVVELDGRFVMTFVFRPYAATCMPNGVRVPRYAEARGTPAGVENSYRSGIAVSDDMRTWEVLGLITPPGVHDRDCVLFPEKIGGRYAMMRRPSEYVGAAYGCTAPSMWLSYSDDLLTWTDPVLMAQPAQEWEIAKIGAASPPVRTEAGWLTLYHGVDTTSRYRVGVMLLNLDDPARVIARAPECIMEPEAYYEKVGVIIPNTVFPTANVIVGDELYIYYGCADTCISLATCAVTELLAYVLQWRVEVV
jgi:predicted GH43/DUF377 family glycosyl hydrolase